MPSSLLVHSSARDFSARLAVCRSRGGIYITAMQNSVQWLACLQLAQIGQGLFVMAVRAVLLTKPGASGRPNLSWQASSCSSWMTRFLTSVEVIEGLDWSSSLMVDCNAGSKLRALIMKRILNLSSSNFPIFVSLLCMRLMLYKV